MNSSKIHFAFVGPGGSGKSTVVSEIKIEHPELLLHEQVNTTTRKQRKIEIETGKSDYTHIPDEEYEYNKVNGLYISTRIKEGKDEDGNYELQKYGLKKPEHDRTLFVVDREGVTYLEEFSKKSGEEIFTIFLEVDRKEAYQRMLLRNSEEVTKDRDAEYPKFMAQKERANAIINANQVVEKVKDDITKILIREIQKHSLYN